MMYFKLMTMTKPIINRSYPEKKALITDQGDISYSQLLS